MNILLRIKLSDQAERQTTCLHLLLRKTAMSSANLRLLMMRPFITAPVFTLSIDTAIITSRIVKRMGDSIQPCNTRLCFEPFGHVAPTLLALNMYRCIDFQYY